MKLIIINIYLNKLQYMNIMENISVRSKNKLKIKKKEYDIKVQIIDWYSEDIEIKNSDSDSDTDENDYNKKFKYYIHLFGNDINGNSIYIRVADFKPYFYLRLPNKWCKNDADKLMDAVKKKLNNVVKESIIDYSFEKKKEFFEFTGGELFNFLKIVFTSRRALYSFRSKFKNEFLCPIRNKKVKFPLYEDKIDPMLRFIHSKNIKPASWIKVNKNQYNILNKLNKMSYCQLDIETHWNNVEYYDSNEMAPFIIGGFDIECDSSHGDFPIAVKDYKKLSENIIDEINAMKKRQKIARSNRDFDKADELNIILDDNDNLKEKIKEFIFIAFSNKKEKEDYTKIELVYTKNNKKPTTRQIETTIEELFEYIHIQEANKTKEDIKKEIKMRIIRITNIMNNVFPEIEGDKVIQIGTTLQYNGESDCFIKHIITLGDCDPIDGAIVESYDNESEVLLAWKRLLRDVDPDLLLGYNIWGFDLRYLHDRAQEIGCYEKFKYLGRMKNYASELVEKEQCSAGMGDNKLYLLDMPGRVIFDLMKYVQRNFNLDSYKLDHVAHHFTKENKNDVSPQEIFALQKGSSADRCTVAKYCIQDCFLCNRLCKKLECINNNIGMANVCLVPLSYIFSRGQGIKIFSLVAKETRKENYLIKTLKIIDSDDIENLEGYEGAVVLNPKPGIYTDEPIGVVDYTSLYPSAMIAENLSHDSYVKNKKYLGDDGAELLKDMGYGHVDITYDNYKYIRVGKGDRIDKIIDTNNPTKTSRFVQFPDGPDGKPTKGLIPRILMNLLTARKETRKKVKTEQDPFKQSILDGLQLAYKVTANSLYGQIGAKTSQIYLKDIAASTTSSGRSMLIFAKEYVEKNFEGAEIIYGDTDSIFINFKPKDENGLTIYGREALIKTIELGQKLEETIQPFLKSPHCLEYEKTFWPFMIITKKRYCGRKFEFDPDKSYINAMGIALKRRDNAGIVKHIYGGIMDRIMNEQDIEKSKVFLKEELMKLARGEFPLTDLIITKSLRSHYKDPDRIAHKVLADRMAERDPGNKPSANDRIPYVYINIKKKSKKEHILQGDMIETPEFIEKNNLTPNYGYYIERQLIKPISQIYDLIMNDSHKLFEESLRYVNNIKDNVKPLTEWFKPK